MGKNFSWEKIQMWNKLYQKVVTVLFVTAEI